MGCCSSLPLVIRQKEEEKTELYSATYGGGWIIAGPIRGDEEM